MLKRIGKSVFLLLIVQSSIAQTFTVSGFIRDGETQETMIGATVYELNSFEGTTSNDFGFYSITLDAKDTVDLIFSFPGFEETMHRLKLSADTTIDVNLGMEIQLEGVEINASWTNITETTQMSTIEISMDQIKKLPALLGEVDVLKSIQLLPGVQSGTEGTSGLYVRGGGPDQNLFLLDGVPLYNVSHIGGVFSVFNADAIKSVKLVKGGYPARYGGRLSSVLDVRMKDGDMNNFQGEGSISVPWAAKFSFEGPIVKDQTSFIVSGRRTLLDPFIKAATSSIDDGNQNYFFYDFNAKVNHKLSDNDRLYLSFYNGKDKAIGEYSYSFQESGTAYNYEEQFGLDWGNLVGALRYNHIFGPKLFSNLTATYTRYNFNVGISDISTQIGPGINERDEFRLDYVSGIEDWGLKWDLDFLPNPQHFVRFGIAATSHKFTPGATTFQVNSSGSTPIDSTLGAAAVKANEFRGFVEDDWKISRKLKANIGAHFSSFGVQDKWYFGIEPRVALRYLATENFAIKASYSQMAQYIHLLSNQGLGLPTDLWVPSTALVEPESSWQTALGIAMPFKDNAYEISLEGYYREMSNIIEYSEGASFLNSQHWEDLTEAGQGKAYGLELFTVKTEGRFTGWLGYTLSWSKRQFDKLNFGEEYNYRYDRRHDVSLVGIFEILREKKENKSLDLSFSWVYGTGRALSVPTARFLGPLGEELEFFEALNSFREPAYHRADLGLNFNKTTKWGEQTWSLSIYNLYNRKNPFFIYRGTDNQGNPAFKQFSLFPIIPGLSYKFKF